MKYLAFCSLIFLLSCNGSEEQSIEIESDSNVVVNEEVETDTVSEKVNTKAPGKYEEFHPNGQLKIEGLNNMYGNREGLWVAYYEDGTKWSETYYSNGIKSGHSVTFFPSGTIRYVGEYKNDERVGTWKFYDETGKLTSEEKFQK